MSRRQQSPGAGAGAVSTTLRPRVRRLISIEDDEETGGGGGSSSSTSNSLHGTVDSAFVSSRRRSPAPSPHPSRATSATRSPQPRASSRTWGLDIPSKPHSKSPSLWASSWTQLQDVASTILGGNIEPLTLGGSKRKSKHARNYSLSVPEEPWGPSGNSDTFLAAGSQEDRLAKVQAEKRKKLLAGLGDEHRDVLGRYKRRSSLDRTDSIPSPTHDDDALVYLHPVQPSDSVAGLSIKYNCTQAVVRKSNRLWANDSIQLRKVAFFPVDACAVRGRKVSTPRQSNIDLLGGTEDTTVVDSVKSNGNAAADYHIAPASPDPATTTTTTTNTTQTESTEEQPWTHDSWVILPHSSSPIEIGRMPRRTLGFFPPARRKSLVGYTDTSPTRSIKSDEAPSNAAPSLMSSAKTSPGRGISPARRPTTRLARSSSAASKLSPHARLASQFLRGPGGVGSLHSSVHGPAPDELNRFVAQHMPQLIIQDAMESRIGETADLPRRGPMPSSGLGLGGPRLSFDRASIASGSTAGTGVEAVAGAVEGWMRKVGGRVKGSLGTPEMRGRNREGDLIELVEGWDLNGATAPPGTAGGDSWESEGHGVVEDAGAANGKGKARARGASGTIVSASARDEEEERLLRERFPPAGRVFEERSKKR